MPAYHYAVPHDMSVLVTVRRLAGGMPVGLPQTWRDVSESTGNTQHGGRLIRDMLHAREYIGLSGPVENM